MNEVGRFEKVSYDQFRKSTEEFFEDYESAIITELGNAHKTVTEKWYSDIVEPKRATKHSAGYDFRSPFDFTLNPHESIKIPTGIRVKIADGWFLGCLPRSSLGFQYKLQLDNTMGVIDGDYYYSDNEGHIMLKMTNNSNYVLYVSAGDRIMQGIFLPYGVTYEDEADGVRNGGFGSTNELKVHLLP